MPAFWWTMVNIHLAISHGACTATTSDIHTYPWCHTTACTATSKIHSGNNSLHYHSPIDMHPPPHCWHSHHQWHAPVPTLPAQPLVTTAATCWWHMHWQLCSSSYYPSIHIQQCRHYSIDVVPSWYVTMPNAAFLNHMQCLMWPFTYIVNLFTYIAYIPISLPSFLLPCNEGIVISYSLIFVVAYGSYFHAMKITWSCHSCPTNSD